MFCKYVIIDDVHAVLFRGIQHKAMQKLGNVTSAGWVVLDKEGMPKVVGESTSLPDKKPLPTDAAMIRLALRADEK